MANTTPLSSTAKEIFDLIRGQEANFPFPVKKRTITVGTFYAATGKFVYSVPTFKEELGGVLGKPPKTLKGGRINAIGAIEVNLEFVIKNRNGDVTVSVPDLPAVSISDDVVTVSVGAADSVTFTISNGNKQFTSELPLEIIRFVGGAGVFELPAFPVAIIYAPPSDQGQKNVSRWMVTKTTGNTTSISVGNDQTTVRPDTLEFTPSSLLADEMRLTARMLDLMSLTFTAAAPANPATLAEKAQAAQAAQAAGALGIISKALNFIAEGLGSVSATEAEGISVTSQHSVTLSVGKEQTITTNPASGGPGSGDLIHYLKNVKLVWFTESVGRLRVSIIGHDGIGVTSVGLLKSGGQTDLDPATVAEFLKLDPFVGGGPSAILPPERFIYLDTIDLNGGEISLTESYGVTDANSKQQTTTHTRVQNSTPGFLKILGLGETEDSTQTVIKQSSVVQSSEDTRKVSNSLDLFAGPDERYSVEVYCDVIFGTFAYRQARSSPTPLLEGEVHGSDGKAVANRIVTLINQGRKYTTRTDSAGRYAFHARAIKPGKFEVKVGSVNTIGTLTAGKTKFNIQA